MSNHLVVDRNQITMCTMAKYRITVSFLTKNKMCTELFKYVFKPIVFCGYYSIRSKR